MVLPVAFATTLIPPSHPLNITYFAKECEFMLIITPANLSSFVAEKDHHPGYKKEKRFDY